MLRYRCFNSDIHHRAFFIQFPELSQVSDVITGGPFFIVSLFEFTLVEYPHGFQHCTYNILPYTKMLEPLKIQVAL